MAKAVEIGLDTDYRVPESDKMNNVATFPFGLGQASPESDPNAKPDLVAALIEIAVETSSSCTEEMKQKVNSICYAVVKARVDNIGPVKAPRQGTGIDLELSVRDKSGQEIYIDRRSSDLGVAPGSNIYFEFPKMPLAVFQKACEIRLFADPDGRIPETDEANNILVKPLEFCGQEPPLPDLRVLRIQIGLAGGQYVLTAEYENAGNEGVHRGYSATWQIEGQSDFSQIMSDNLEPMAVQKWVFSIPVSNIPADKTSLRVRLELNDGKATGRIEERSLDNNALEIDLKLPGK